MAFVGAFPLSSRSSNRPNRTKRCRWFSKRDGSQPGRYTCVASASRNGQSPDAKTYRVTVHDPKRGVVHSVQVPEDRYIWWSMEDHGADLPSSCRHGCCTTCAVRIKSGELQQDEALGLMKEMRSRGYALLCVSYPRSDIVCELQEEDEVYLQQFGDSFESGGVTWGGVVPEDD